ncbi:hypothetical protein [Sporolactobacillus terrae]|uniref:hypothetical protein n=1 Tax=Sporolactobacillus terrae TaxID=269673 RepID=UPI00048F92B6|nr:hypothetical protein [Sporolactobacillus terrae]
MFSAEDGAWAILDKAVKKYEDHFDDDFPVYEYAEMTSGNGFDFSVDGARRLSKFIDERIKQGKPVAVPDGYEDRLY